MNNFAQLRAELEEMVRPFAEVSNRRFDERVKIMDEEHDKRVRVMEEEHDKRVEKARKEFEERSLINHIEHRIEVIKSRLDCLDIAIFPPEAREVVNAFQNHSVEEILQDCLSNPNSRELIESIYDSM